MYANLDRSLTPYDAKFVASQTKEHNVESLDGHEWEEWNNGQMRTCK